MKKAELTTGMHVAIARGRKWLDFGIDEAIVLDADTLYEEVSYGYNSQKYTVTFEDPRNPGQRVTGIAMRKGGKSVAVLRLKTNWMRIPAETEWQVQLVGLNSLVGLWEDCKAQVDEDKARKDAARAQKLDARVANSTQWAKLKEDHLLLNSGVSFDAESGRVTLTIGRLKDLLEGHS